MRKVSINSPITHRKFNNLLIVADLLIAMYILIVPLLPAVTYWVKNVVNAQPPLVKAVVNDTKVDIPKQNTVVIPSINLQEPINSGADESALNMGIWHRPATGSPEDGGNFVLVGHRFTYAGPAVFYHLDKLEVGDEITIYWQQQRYVYRVFEKMIVSPSAVEVEAPTSRPKLTLYTCTPLWTAENRLVIQAELMEEQ